MLEEIIKVPPGWSNPEEDKREFRLQTYDSNNFTLLPIYNNFPEPRLSQDKDTALKDSPELYIIVIIFGLPENIQLHFVLNNLCNDEFYCIKSWLNIFRHIRLHSRVIPAEDCDRIKYKKSPTV